jgi:hypothetical protein
MLIQPTWSLPTIVERLWTCGTLGEGNMKAIGKVPPCGIALP